MKKDQHTFEGGECINCGIMEECADGETCEKEDLSMWSVPNQTTLDAIRQAAERDK